MTDAEQAANRYVNGSKALWADIVAVAWVTKPENLDRAAKVLSESAGVGKEALKRKMLAVHYAMRIDSSQMETVVSAGQKAILALYVKGKRSERTEGLATLKWRVAPDLAEAVHKEVWRIAKVLKLKTSDDFWSWLHSQMVTWTTEEILHSAGEGDRIEP